jgi:hypothetical protein
MEFNIKITGSGTKEEILKSLLDLVKGIQESDTPILDGAEWEDKILITEINAK